jgi:hypothetical protein
MPVLRAAYDDWMARSVSGRIRSGWRLAHDSMTAGVSSVELLSTGMIS